MVLTGSLGLFLLCCAIHILSSYFNSFNLLLKQLIALLEGVSVDLFRMCITQF